MPRMREMIELVYNSYFKYIPYFPKHGHDEVRNERHLKKIKLESRDEKYKSDMKNIMDGSNTAKGKNSELENISIQTILLKKNEQSIS